MSYTLVPAGSIASSINLAFNKKFQMKIKIIE